VGLRRRQAARHAPHDRPRTCGSGSTEELTKTGLTKLDRETWKRSSELQATAGSVTDQLQIATTRIEGLQGSITASLFGGRRTPTWAES